jgi:hypothetical protein
MAELQLQTRNAYLDLSMGKPRLIYGTTGMPRYQDTLKRPLVLLESLVPLFEDSYFRFIPRMVDPCNSARLTLNTHQLVLKRKVDDVPHIARKCILSPEDTRLVERAIGLYVKNDPTW